MPGRRWQLGFATGAVLLAAADTYVVVVALTSIMSGVGVGLDRLQRATPIVSGFLLGYVVVLPLIGRVADLAGREPVFVACLAAFCAGSVVTATAHALPVVVAGRAIQGVGGGGLVPVTLALVAQRWPADQRGVPLGVVGALQEFGSLLGPLYGAAILAIASWRAIFWVNVPLGALLGLGFWGSSFWGSSRRAGHVDGRRDVVGAVLLILAAAVAVVALEAPSDLATSPTWGRLYQPGVAGRTWGTLTTPVAFAAAGLLVLFVIWETVAPLDIHPLVPLRRVAAVLRRCDPPGAVLLAGVLACVVVAFSTSDPSRNVVASSAPVLGPLAAVLAVVFVIRQRQAAAPLIDPDAVGPRGAWGGLVVNLAVGAALMAALVDVPLFARATVASTQTGAALVLVRFLVAVPVGALAGGWACRRLHHSAWVVASLGMALAAVSFVAMTSWSTSSLNGAGADVALVACGLGFGLVIPPVNLTILAVVPGRLHSLAGALAVVARSVGMLTGVSALTAIGLHRFYADQARIGSPFALCPTHPGSCRRYEQATTQALLTELHTIFAGAAVCAAVAAVAAAVLLRPARPAATSDAGDTTMSSAPRRSNG